MKRLIIIATLVWATLVPTAVAQTSAMPICVDCVPRPSNVYASDEPNYKGMATIDSDRFGSSCDVCLDMSRALPVSAWKWTATGWRSASLAHGTRVYVWPFGSGWEWVYDYGRASWFAVRADRVLIRTNDYGCGTYPNFCRAFS